MIDSRAVVDSKARIDASVSIGPYSIIGADVQIDSGTEVGPHVVIKGPTTIGQDNKIYQFASVGEDPQDKKYKGERTYLEVGDRNIIREYCTVHRGTVQDKGLTRIGNDNLFMAYTHVAHDCMVGDQVVMANGASLAGHVFVGDYTVLGGFSLIHQFCKIGQHSFSAMGSLVLKDIPPYIMVAGQPTRPYGINSVGLERNGFDAESIGVIRQSYKILYKAGLTLGDAIKKLTEMIDKHPEITTLVSFLRNANRGIIR